jgi:hypothetical protein
MILSLLRNTVLVTALLALTACHRRDLHQTLRNNNFQAPQGTPTVLAAYQPWFGRPEHINVGYSSHDRTVLAAQIEHAKSLGITGFVVNWYGPRKEFEDKSYALLQELAANTDFKVALMYDEDNDDPGRSTEAVLVDLQYAYDRYIGPHAQSPKSSYLHYMGRPVIFIFPKGTHTDWGRVRQLVDSWDERPLLIYKDPDPSRLEYFDGFYAWVQPGGERWAHDGSNWGKDYLQTFYHEMTSKYPDKIAVGAAWPGFDDSQASWTENRRMSARCGKTLEDSLRLFRRYYNNSRSLPFLMIVTWNDYEEGTAIERGFADCDKVTTSTSQQRAEAR